MNHKIKINNNRKYIYTVANLVKKLIIIFYVVQQENMN